MLLFSSSTEKQKPDFKKISLFRSNWFRRWCSHLFYCVWVRRQIWSDKSTEFGSYGEISRSGIKFAIILRACPEADHESHTDTPRWCHHVSCHFMVATSNPKSDLLPSVFVRVRNMVFLLEKKYRLEGVSGLDGRIFERKWEEVKEGRENCMMRSFIICIIRKILLRR
jgi:hypothetical protein